jgi:hypothetical protein
MRNHLTCFAQAWLEDDKQTCHRPWYLTNGRLLQPSARWNIIVLPPFSRHWWCLSIKAAFIFLLLWVDWGSLVINRQSQMMSLVMEQWTHHRKGNTKKSDNDMVTTVTISSPIAVPSCIWFFDQCFYSQLLERISKNQMQVAWLWHTTCSRMWSLPPIRKGQTVKPI